MARIVKDFHPPGTAPGTLPARAREPGGTRVLLLDLACEKPESAEITDPAQLAGGADKAVTWVHVMGFGDLDAIRRVGEAFGLHPLALEDAVHGGQRPKIEDYERHDFVILQHAAHRNGHVALTQVAMFFSETFVVTFQPAGDDLLAPVRERACRGGLLGKSADYLAYAIMDFVIDSGFPLLESLGDDIEAIEERVVAAPAHRENMRQLHRLRHDLRQLRRALWPQRDVLSRTLQDGGFAFSAATRVYLRDLYDHAMHILDVVETYREMVADINDLYLSGLSVRLNEVIRILTVIATIFIPLTFIVGVYGMNFDRSSPWNMPELGWTYGYLILWAVMIAIAGGMLLFFRRKGWL